MLIERVFCAPHSKFVSITVNLYDETTNRKYYLLSPFSPRSYFGRISRDEGPTEMIEERFAEMYEDE